MIDTFLYPTKELALLVRNDVREPQSLGIVSATRGYIDLTRWETIDRRALQAGRRATPARGRLRRRPDASALRARTPGRPARRGVLRRGRHDLGRLRTRASASAARSSDSATRGCSGRARTPHRTRLGGGLSGEALTRGILARELGRSPQSLRRPAAPRSTRAVRFVRQRATRSAARAAHAAGRGLAVVAPAAAAYPGPTARRRVQPTRAIRTSTCPTPATRAVRSTEPSVSKLGVAWSCRSRRPASTAATPRLPIVSDGVDLLAGPRSNVQAINLKTGKVLWTQILRIARPGTERPRRGRRARLRRDRERGVRTRREDRQAALVGDARAQRPRGHRHGARLPRRDRVRLDGAREQQQVLRRRRHRHPVGARRRDAAGSCGISTPSRRRQWCASEINSGGGVWYSPAFDGQGSHVHRGWQPGAVPGHGPVPWGSSRPGPNLYTDSLVKLDATTGKLEWYYQQTPHDLYDHDLQDPPMLVGAGGRRWSWRPASEGS